MYTRYLFPDFWTACARFPVFKLGKLGSVLRSMPPMSFHDYGGKILLRPARPSADWELSKDDLLLEQMGQVNPRDHTCPVTVSTPASFTSSFVPYGSFYTVVRYLLEKYAKPAPLELPLTVTFSVPAQKFGTSFAQVNERLIDTLRDYHDRAGYMILSGAADYDPQEPNALISIADEDAAVLRVQCSAPTPQRLIGLLDAVIRRLRPQYQQESWTWSILETLFLDLGMHHTSSGVDVSDQGFFLYCQPPGWLDKPRDDSLVIPGRGDRYRPATYTTPAAHFLSLEPPRWIEGRTFRVQKCRRKNERLDGLWCEWAQA